MNFVGNKETEDHFVSSDSEDDALASYFDHGSDSELSDSEDVADADLRANTNNGNSVTTGAYFYINIYIILLLLYIIIFTTLLLDFSVSSFYLELTKFLMIFQVVSYLFADDQLKWPPPGKSLPNGDMKHIWSNGTGDKSLAHISSELFSSSLMFLGQDLANSSQTTDSLHDKDVPIPPGTSANIPVCKYNRLKHNLFLLRLFFSFYFCTFSVTK